MDPFIRYTGPSSGTWHVFPRIKPRSTILTVLAQIVCLVDALVSVSLFLTVTNIPYWYRPHRSPTKLPVLFIHGLGIGLNPYVAFLRELVAQDPDVESLPLSCYPFQFISPHHHARDDICGAITRILDAHGLHRVVVVGHSYGTVVAAHLLHRQQGTTPQGAEQPLQEENHTSVGDTIVIPTNANEPIIAVVLLIDPIPSCCTPRSRVQLFLPLSASRERVAAVVLCEPRRGRRARARTAPFLVRDRPLTQGRHGCRAGRRREQAACRG
jgi:pimeloyl-ACP methyl ester carboxylesterase